MNKRIQELLFEAGATAGWNQLDTELVDYEKFAELIVRECIRQILEVRAIKDDEVNDYSMGFTDGMLVATRIIEEDFDIKPKYKKTEYDEFSWRFDRDTQ